MDLQEKEQLFLSAQRLKARELHLDSWEDPYFDMTGEEKSKLLVLFSEKIHSLEKLIELQSANASELKQLRCQVQELTSLLLSSNRKLELAEKRASDLEAQLKLERKNRYGSKSQKRKKTTDNGSQNPISHEEEKDKFDGTDESLSSGKFSDSSSMKFCESSEVKEKEIRLFRQGMKYRKMTADKRIDHKSDCNRLPEGAVIIAVQNRYSYDQVSQIVEHRWEMIRYKMPDGKIYEGYFPTEGDPLHVDKVPGTHASANFLSYLAFNKYVLDTPLYREMFRLTDEKMILSRMSLTNWLHKGSKYISEVVKHLMNLCIHEGADLNGDETWIRVKGGNNHYTKKYTWCIVNRKAKTTIYYYEHGSRGRDVLRHLIGDTQIRSFQSDGYNVYMYLDDLMLDIDHICCMAHVRAKFQYAYEQGDRDADFFLECIGELYRLEEEYKQGRLSPEQITACRQGLKTKEILIRMRSKLDALLADDHPIRGELMEKALRYLKTFWTQLFNYLKNGDYTIDNTVAERCIRPLSGERKNSLFFGSDKMAVASAAYHTVITTCRMHDISALDYLKKFFGEIVMGRRDYENLLPQTIGILANKH